MQNQYFYLVHLFNPNLGCLGVPIYIETNSSNDAKLQADDFIKLCKVPGFETLFPPSDPILVMDINRQRVDALTVQLLASGSIIVNLPSPNKFTFHQLQPFNLPLQSLQAGIIVPGNFAAYYSL
jgi:hypothetical protein